jgi:hypothetical protein
MEDRGGRLLLRRSGIKWGHPRPMQNVSEFLRTVGCERYGGKSRDPGKSDAFVAMAWIPGFSS